MNATQGAELVPLGPGDRVGMLLPLFHANAQVVTTLIPIMIGCEIVMWERFSASKFWETVEELQPASLSAVSQPAPRSSRAERRALRTVSESLRARRPTAVPAGADA